MDLESAVSDFMVACGQTVGEFNVNQIALYTGMQFEEMAERMEAIFGNDHPVPEWLHSFARSFKNKEYNSLIELADRKDLLDSNVDLAWVTLAAAYSEGAYVHGAVNAVGEANMAKLEACWHCEGTGVVGVSDLCPNCQGVGKIAVKDANGKVQKPWGWTPPDLSSCVCTSPAKV